MRVAGRRNLLAVNDRQHCGLLLEIKEVKLNRALESRYNILTETSKFNLNGSKDNACAEALALAVVHGKGDVLAERELVRVSGMGDMIPGTPDGAVILSTGGMAATQVVRAGESRGRNGLKRLVRTLLIKVYKSLCWLSNTGSLGESVCNFVIACWIPRRLSTKAIRCLQEMLRKAGDIDHRFEVLLLVPPSGSWREHIFPKKFGSLRCTDLFLESEADKQGLDLLLRKIHAYRDSLHGGCCEHSDDLDNDALGFLAVLLEGD
jgi:hypothetical protein